MTHVVLVLFGLIALFAAGYLAPLPLGLAIAAAGAGGRVLLDPAVDSAPDVVLTFVAAALPVLVGRWGRGQVQLRREMVAKSERLEQERRRDADQAAEEERMRIAGDLQAAATDSLDRIARDTGAAQRHIEAWDLSARSGDAGARRRHRPSGPRRRPPRARDPPSRAAHAARSRRRGRPRRDAAAPVVFPIWALPAALLVAAVVEGLLRFGRRCRRPAVLLAAPLLARERRPNEAAAGVLAAVALQSVLLDPESMPASSIVAIICASYSIGAYAPSVAGLLAFAVATVVHASLVHSDAVPQALIGGTLVPWTVGRIRRGQKQLMREAADARPRSSATASGTPAQPSPPSACAWPASCTTPSPTTSASSRSRPPARTASSSATRSAPPPWSSSSRAVTEEALVELGRLADEHDAQPGLAGVDALAERARAAGLPVEVHVEGERAPLPAGIDLAAFRIVQEALANASKHAGPAHARVSITYEPRAIALEIDDDGRGPNGAAGGGHGLVGMRERVALYGGTLETGRRVTGGFAVRARLPL